MREVRRKAGVECRWLDIRSPCEFMLHTIGGGAEIAQIDYFSALAHHIEASRPGTVARHERYIDALGSTGVKTHLGVFKPEDIRCRSRTCEVLLRRHEEKETDVAIAAAIVETADREDHRDDAKVLHGVDRVAEVESLRMGSHFRPVDGV